MTPMSPSSSDRNVRSRSTHWSDELPAVDEDERIAAAACDQRRGDHGLAERGRGGQHAAVVRRQRLHRCGLPVAQRAQEADRQGCAASRRSTILGFDAVRPEQLLRLVEASPRQPHVVRMEFGAGDDARLAEGGQPHRLGAVELRVLERGDAHEPRHQRWREPGAVDVDRSASTASTRSGSGPVTVRRLAAPDGGQQPRLVGVLVLDRQPHARARRARGPRPRRPRPPDCGAIHSAASEDRKAHWSSKRLELVVDEQAVALLAGLPLQAAGRSGCQSRRLGMVSWLGKSRS